MKIALDAGHGYNTPGKRTPDGIREWSLNETVLRGFQSEIAKYGVQTVRLDDPTGKTDVGLIQRTDTSRTHGCDYLISFHHNAYQSKWGDHGGTETFVATGTPDNLRLANTMQTSVLATLGLRDRGVKVSNYFHIIREAGVPAVLVELGFMDSNTDKVIRDEAVRFVAGVNMANAFAREYGLKEVGNPATPKPTPNPTNPNATSYQRPSGTYTEVGGGGRFTNTCGSNIHMRQYVPNVNGVYNGMLAHRAYVDYRDVYIGNGFVWVGNGTTWIPTGAHNGSKRIEDAWGTFSEYGGKTPAKPAKSVEQMAREVANGDHGTGHANRQKSLGVDNATYQKVRARVNQIV